jgi:hypothetical protein
MTRRFFYLIIGVVASLLTDAEVLSSGSSVLLGVKLLYRRIKPSKKILQSAVKFTQASIFFPNDWVFYVR